MRTSGRLQDGFCKLIWLSPILLNVRLGLCEELLVTTLYAFGLVNILGGIAVLGSYIWGLSSYPEHRETLWGGISGAWRWVFFVSMMLAAVGYLTFAYYEFFRSGAKAYQENGILGPYTVSIICAVFLCASTVWMPSTLAYINTHQVQWWLVALSSLWVTAASLFLLLIALLLAGDYESSRYYYLAVGGIAYILFHCTVFDAVVWAIRFPRFD